ncbi:heterokaryon incompatibility domain-containing protein [Trichoderma chlorosporum]
MVAAQVIQRPYPAYGMEFCLSSDGVPMVTVLDSDCCGRKEYEFILRVPPNECYSADMTTIDTSWIDLNLATMWKNACVSQRDSQCKESDKSVVMAPDWLIDTKENRLVRGEASMEFVALSYRWGTSVGPKVCLDDLDELQQPDGVFNSIIAKLPIIRDAMHVVQSIRERYLWVDAMCIVHDDEDHLAHQLQHMGAIFASAKLAIIASDGDGMTGLPGLKGCSAPRNLDGVFPWTKNREIFVRDLPSLNFIHVPEYYKRGWTFQEYVLSPRRLIFNKQQIHWTCNCGSWHEDLPYRRSSIVEADETVVQTAKILRKRPDFNAFDSLIRSYNNLEMTYPEDALPGIAGLLKLISPSFEGGFLCGLPIVSFEAALLWGCKFWYGNTMGLEYKGLERREDSGKTHSLLPDADLPSWSWIGWKSHYLTLLKDEEDYQVVTYPNNPEGEFLRSEKWITIPTTQWFCQETPTSTTKYRIQSSWFKLHKARDDEILPKGWTRGKYLCANGLNAANYRSLPLGIAGEYVYHHPDVPDRLFWRPFTVSVDKETASLNQMKQCKYISCKTKRSWFRCLRKTGSAMEAGDMDYHLQVLDKRSRVCGWIQLSHADAPLPGFYKEADAVTPGGIKTEETEFLSDIPSFSESSSLGNHDLVELVVVCQRFFSESVCYERHQWLDRRAYRPFYGVLCVEWKRGVAYRTGYGYISRKGWEQQEAEDVDLILG